MLTTQRERLSVHGCPSALGASPIHNYFCGPSTLDFYFALVAGHLLARFSLVAMGLLFHIFNDVNFSEHASEP